MFEDLGALAAGRAIPFRLRGNGVRKRLLHRRGCRPPAIGRPLAAVGGIGDLAALLRDVWLPGTSGARSTA
jgi:hypothetical protein